MKQLTFLVFLFIILVPAAKPKLSISEIKSSSLNESELASVTEKLTQEMIATEHFIVLEREDMEALMAEQMLRETELSEENGSPQIQPVSADLMLSCSVEKIEKKLFMTNLKIVDITTGMIKKAVSEEFNGPFKKFLSKGLKKVVESLKWETAEEKKKEEKPGKRSN
jgi:curli biogenesis system outer membrane secretion channel CsgG